MDKLTTALAPVFAAGFAVQQLLEIVTSFFDLDEREGFQKFKKAILGLIALVIGITIALTVNDLHVLKTLLTQTTTDASGKAVTLVPDINRYLDAFVTGLIISAGTEGVNSILKFLKYSKEEKKTDAAAKTEGKSGAVASAAEAATVPAPTADALKKMNYK
jgi:hypothetical protein